MLAGAAPPAALAFAADAEVATMGAVEGAPGWLLSAPGTPEAPAPPAQPTATPDQTAAARALLFTALRALSQRTLTAITNLFSLILVSVVALLAWRILDDPTTNRLIVGGGFASFCLLIDIVRRRNK